LLWRATSGSASRLGLREMPPELGAFMLGYLLIMASPGPNMVAISTIAALEGLASALPMIAGIAFGVGVLARFVAPLRN